MLFKMFIPLFAPDDGAGSGGDAGQNGGGSGSPAGGQGGSNAQTDTQPGAGNKGPDFERMYKGLQTKHQELVETSRATEENLNKELGLWQQRAGQVTATRDDLTNQLTTLNTQISELTTSNQGVVAERDAATANNERLKLLLVEFPDLAKFEQEGLLPTTGSAEELREAFTKFRNTLSQAGVKAASDAVTGATPPPPAAGPQGGESVDELMDLAFKYNREGKFKEHNEIMDRIFAINADKFPALKK